MKKLATIVSILLFFFCFTAFTNFFGRELPEPIPISKQRTGDAQKGYNYLATGDYIRSGIPLSAFLFGNGKDKRNYLQRTGDNADISYEYTVVLASNGERVVAPNCLQCHAQVFDGKLIIGLGNSEVDFTKESMLNAKNLSLLEKFLKMGAKSKYEAALPFLTVSKAVAPYLYAEVQGANTADHLAAVLAAHRDPISFQWSATPNIKIPFTAVPTDTPPWWLLKKKNAMFYSGMGRGDFGRFLMASNLLTVVDTSEANSVDAHMPDLLSYIYSIKPPTYPASINSTFASEGKILFEKTCSGCHGIYGEKESYPNLLIPQHILGTDSLLQSSNYSSPQFVEWFNRSWFTKGSHPALLHPYRGYIAPPLDGIWITAPYLHNGSVPDLQSLLDSSERPTYWKRSFSQQEYDYNKVGWKYIIANPDTKGAYNTTLPGYGNDGHQFGDKLTAQQRSAIIEYLKTL